MSVSYVVSWLKKLAVGYIRNILPITAIVLFQLFFYFNLRETFGVEPARQDRMVTYIASLIALLGSVGIWYVLFARLHYYYLYDLDRKQFISLRTAENCPQKVHLKFNFDWREAIFLFFPVVIVLAVYSYVFLPVAKPFEWLSVPPGMELASLRAILEYILLPVSLIILGFVSEVVVEPANERISDSFPRSSFTLSRTIPGLLTYLYLQISVLYFLHYRLLSSWANGGGYNWLPIITFTVFLFFPFFYGFLNRNIFKAYYWKGGELSLFVSNLIMSNLFLIVVLLILPKWGLVPDLWEFAEKVVGQHSDIEGRFFHNLAKLIFLGVCIGPSEFTALLVSIPVSMFYWHKPLEWTTSRISTSCKRVLNLFRSLLASEQLLRQTVKRFPGVFLLSVPLFAVLSVLYLLLFLVWDRITARDLVLITNVWLLSFVGFITPIFLNFARIREAVQDAFDDTLQATVMNMKHHYLLLGYGDLGLRVVRELLKKGILTVSCRRDVCEKTTAMLMPDMSLALLNHKMLVVDKKSELFQNIFSTGRGPGFAVVQTPILTEESVAVKCYLPVVVGDIIHEETRSIVGFERADSLISCARSFEAPLKLFDILRSREREGIENPSAILSVVSSLHLQMTNYMVYCEPLRIHYVYPDHLSGMDMANVVYAAYRRLKEQGEGTLNFLILGKGHPIFYLLESLIKIMAPPELEEFKKRVRVICLTDDQEVCKSTPSLFKGKLPFEQRELERRLLSSKLQVHCRRIQQYIQRPNDYTGSDRLEIPVIYQEVFSFEALHYLLYRVLGRRYYPDVVVISDFLIGDELNAIKSLFTALTHIKAQHNVFKYPIVLFNAETGDPERVKSFSDALIYYSSLMERDAEGHPNKHYKFLNDNLFPYQRPLYPPRATGRLEGDPCIDVLEDPKARIVGTVESYKSSLVGDSTSLKGIPCEINICGYDVPGVFAYVCASLAGYKRGDLSPSWPKEDRLLSLSDARILSKVGAGEGLEKLEFVAYGNLVTYSHSENSQKIFRVLYNLNRKAVSGKRTLKKIEDAMGILWLGNKHTFTRRDFLDPLKDEKVAREGLYRKLATYCSQVNKGQKNCCGMVWCPMANFYARAISETSLARKEIDARNAKGIGEAMFGIIKKQWGEYPKERNRPQNFVFDQMIFYPGPKNQKGYPKNPPKDLASAPLAYIRIDIESKPIPGVLARVLNFLIGRDLIVDTKVESNYKFNGTYFCDYQCNDPRFMIFTLVGKMEPHKCEGPPELIRLTVRILPVTEFGAWTKYKDRLQSYLGDVLGKDIAKVLCGKEARWHDQRVSPKGLSDSGTCRSI